MYLLGTKPLPLTGRDSGEDLAVGQVADGYSDYLMPLPTLLSSLFSFPRTVKNTAVIIMLGIFSVLL